MAKCEEGYLCDVCGGDVAELVDSDLYLRYVIGQIDPGGAAHHARAAHPLQSGAGAVHRRRRLFRRWWSKGPFDKRQLDPAYVAERERLVTRGYRRLRELAGLNLPIIEYPLPEVRAEIALRLRIARRPAHRRWAIFTVGRSEHSAGRCPRQRPALRGRRPVRPSAGRLECW